MSTLRIAGPTLAGALFLAGPAGAQLDLPKKAPARADARPSKGLEIPSGQGGDLAPRAEGEEPVLQLPGVPALAPEPAIVPGSEGGPASHYEPTSAGAAAYVFDQLADVADPDASLALSAVDSLGALGSAGLDASRAALHVRDATGIVTAARVLVRYGGPADRAAVVQRLRSELPDKAAGPLLATAANADPVLMTPELLVELLDHPTTALRTAAFRTLADRRPDATALPALAVRLGSARTQTRLLALELIVQVEDPSVRHLLASRLGDKTGKVAQRASELLAGLADAEVPALLFDRAFGGDGLDRQGAYALLALVDREKRTRVTLLRDEHVPRLLAGLRSEEAIVAGASAVALAGIGFHSHEAGALSWLDRDVPHTLVRLATGAVFHRDFTALQGPALDRLALITGQGFGRNGQAWQTWWADNADGFHARRAVLVIAPEETGLIRIDYRRDQGAGDGWVLVGPGLGPDEEDGRAIYLSGHQAGELVASLEAEGILGGERLPARVSDPFRAARRLEIRVRDRDKRFEVPLEADLPWFAAVESAVQDLVRESGWQRLHPAGTTRHDFWLAEHEWWERETRVVARARRMKQLLLARLHDLPVRERGVDLAELSRLYAEPGVPEPADFPHLLDLLGEEELFGDRSHSLFGLALVAAATTGTPPRPEGATVEPVLAEELLDLLARRFGEDARSECERVLAAAGRAAIRDAAGSEDGFRRSLAPRGLASRPEAVDLELLLALLRDPDQRVEIACVRALGENRVEAARDELLRRARSAPAAVRAEALTAMGRLGGDEVLNACILGLAEEDRAIQMAAVGALARLADPESAALLASLFARGPESSFFAPAREGLQRLAEAGWSELLRLTSSAGPTVRREAALLLAEEGCPQAVSTLLQVLTEAPEDARVAEELAVLSCVDLRAEEEPARAWWRWWDGVVHDDSLAWLRAAGERAELPAPSSEDLAGAGTRAGAEFLLDLMQLPPPNVAERARRELERLTATALDPLPEPGPDRRERVLEIERAIDESYGE